MSMKSVAAKVRAAKEKWPLRYCPNTRCLWNLSHGPCPKHMARKEIEEIRPRGLDNEPNVDYRS
jgi:hypothetical protein